MSIENKKGDFDDVSLFEGLPCELTWKIIEFVPEAVFSLRLTNLDITFEVPNHLANLIELRLALSDSQYSLRSCITSLFRDRPDIATVCYRSKFNERLEFEKALSILARAMHGGVGRVIQSYWSDDKMLEVIAKLLENIEFRKLKLSISTLTDDTRLYILKCLKANPKIDRLSLYVWGVELSDTVKFLLELSSQVRSLKIRQCYQHKDRKRHFFFGMDNIEWAPVILEMFSGILEKLTIGNHLYPRYLSSASADALRKRLPQIGKKIWFEATCNVYPIAMNYTDNEYTVQADSSDTKHAGFLRIKHCSRVDELFKDNYPANVRDVKKDNTNGASGYTARESATEKRQICHECYSRGITSEMSTLSNLPLNAIDGICNFLPEKSILQLRTTCKSTNKAVCSLLSIRETVVDNIRFHGESVSFAIHFSKRNVFLWKLCLLYALSQLKFFPPFKILKMVSSGEVQINMSPGSMGKVLHFVKSLIPHATFYHLLITGTMYPEIMHIYSQFIEGKSLKTVFLNYSLSDPENCQALIEVIPKIQTEYLSLDLYCEITKSTIGLILACANMPGRLTINMENSLFPEKVDIVSLIQDILSMRCSNLRYLNYQSRISQEQVEKLIQVFHHLNKKVFFATFSEIRAGPQSFRKVGAYNTSVPNGDMVIVKHVDLKTLIR